MTNETGQNRGGVIELKDFLDGVVLRTVKPISVGAGSLYLFLIVLLLVFSDEVPWALWFALINAVMAAFFFGLYWLVRQDRIPA